MKLNIKCVTLATVMTTILAIGGAMEVNAQTDVFTDTFDAAPTNGTTRVLVPDNSATGGQFPSSAFDVFGIVDRAVNFDFSDDSVINNSDADPMNDDTFGIFPPSKTDLFLGFADTTNDDNTSGEVSVTWSVSAAGFTDLSLSFEIAAMGDFEASDVLTFTASFDGGPAETLVTSTFEDTPDGDMFTYTLDDGSLAIAPFQADTTINDPFVVDGQLVINELQAFTFPITGTGSQLTLTLTYDTNGTGEPMAIDNVSVSGTGGVIKGDVNMSGVVDFADIPAFIGVLQGNGFQPEADCDCSKVVDFADIPVFITILQGG